MLRLVGAAIGAVVADGPGAAWGLAIGAVLGLGVLQVQYRAALRGSDPEQVSLEPPELVLAPHQLVHVRLTGQLP